MQFLLRECRYSSGRINPKTICLHVDEEKFGLWWTNLNDDSNCVVPSFAVCSNRPSLVAEAEVLHVSWRKTSEFTKRPLTERREADIQLMSRRAGQNFGHLDIE